MPTRPRPGCDVLGCPNRKPCAQHPRPSWQNVDPKRGTTAQRGYGAAHVRWRAQVLARDPECRYQLYGCTKVATVADHVVRIVEGGDRYDLENGAGACRHCHAVKSQQESRG